MILEPQNHQEPQTYSVTKEPFSHGTGRGFLGGRPNFQGMLWGLPPIFLCGTALAQAAGDSPPCMLGEIRVLLAPSYWQARQLEVTKQSPPRAVTLNLSVESPKTKCSGGKSSLHCGLGHSSNISTPKCPDSTSAKKPSSSKEPTSNSQEKSPKAHGSHKCGHSPSPSAKSVRHKQKMSTQKKPAHSTPPFPSAPVCLMASAVQWALTAM